MRTVIAPSYIPTYLNNNLKNGQIFSVSVAGREKRVVGRLAGSNGNSFDVKPMTGEKGTEPERIFCNAVQVIKIKGEEVETFN